MKILYVPLDERPCNFAYPQMIASLQPQLQLVTPPLELLGQKKQAANVDHLWQWVHTHIGQCQTALLSIEMLIYGGLLPSRLHHTFTEELLANLDQVRCLKTTHPDLEIFASNLIMRTPSYSSSEEEPDYYAEFGASIFRWGWFHDKKSRVGLTTEETAQLDQIEQDLPSIYLEDYRQRRVQNLSINMETIKLVNDGIITFLSIPQDDCATYGFTAMDQTRVADQIRTLRLQQRVHLYPGADEVGCTLLARAYAQLQGKCSKIHVLYSSVASEHIIPLYEDRPLGESVKAHILAAGAQVVPTPQMADVTLAVNTAGKVMQEAWDQSSQDLTYTTHRNLPCFVAQIEHLLMTGGQVAIADVAFTNGGETELVQLLDNAALWDSILAYGGWNTSCNAIGTVLATAILGLDSDNALAINTNKIYHLLDGWAYQSIVRADIVKQYLPTIGASYYNFNGQETLVNQEIECRLRQVWQRNICRSFMQWNWDQMEVFSPWHRMFEIGLNLTISANQERNRKGSRVSASKLWSDKV